MKDITPLLSKESVHQSILNVGYDEWQTTDKNWGYSDMVKWVKETYGDLPALAILLGKYNQQVTNGGHVQYFDNGYSSMENRGWLDKDKDTELHDLMVELFEKLDFKSLELGGEMLTLLRDFEVEIDEESMTEETCNECYGNGTVENPDFDPDDEDSFEEDYMDCDWCGGSGWEECDNPNYGCVDNSSYLSGLDDRYYKIDDRWMEVLEEYFTKVYFG